MFEGVSKFDPYGIKKMENDVLQMVRQAALMECTCDAEIWRWLISEVGVKSARELLSSSESCTSAAMLLDRKLNVEEMYMRI